MDFTGTFLGLLTIPMLLLNVMAGMAAVWLAARGDFHNILIGIVVFMMGSIGATFLQRADGRLANFARSAVESGRLWTGYAAALINSGGPVAIIILWELGTLLILKPEIDDTADIALWLWSYGVVTGIWTLRAFLANRRNLTLVTIQAYSAQLGYVALSVALLLLDWTIPGALALMLVPMVLPLIVGFLLALADRGALDNVQI